MLNLRLLKVYSSQSISNIGLFSFYRNLNSYSRKFCGTTQYVYPDYAYESGELMEKLKSSTNCNVIAAASNNVNIESYLANLKERNCKSNEDVQAIVTSIILAAKLDQNVESIIEKSFGIDAVDKFLALCDTWQDRMNADEAVSTLIALNLLKIPLHHPVNRKLTIHVANLLRGNFSDVIMMQ